MEIRTFEERDWPQVWPIVEQIIRKGDTFCYDPLQSEAQAHDLWVVPAPGHVVVAVEGRGTRHLQHVPQPSGPGCAYRQRKLYVRSRSTRSGCRPGIGRVPSRTGREAVNSPAFEFNARCGLQRAGAEAVQASRVAMIGTVPGAFRHPRWVRSACMSCTTTWPRGPLLVSCDLVPGPHARGRSVRLMARRRRTSRLLAAPGGAAEAGVRGRRRPMQLPGSRGDHSRTRHGMGRGPAGADWDHHRRRPLGFPRSEWWFSPRSERPRVLDAPPRRLPRRRAQLRIPLAGSHRPRCGLVIGGPRACDRSSSLTLPLWWARICWSGSSPTTLGDRPGRTLGRCVFDRDRARTSGSAPRGRERPGAASARDLSRHHLREGRRGAHLGATLMEP